MTEQLSRKDHFVIAASSLVEPPVFYVGVQETAKSIENYKQKVQRIALILMSLGELPK